MYKKICKIKTGKSTFNSEIIIYLTFIVVCDEYKLDVLQVNVRVPQRSALGPLLFHFVISDISQLEMKNVLLFFYAESKKIMT